jgi:hypothetical protein
MMKGICYCNVSGCRNLVLIRIFSQTGKTIVAQYCEEHTLWALEQIAHSYHIIRKVKP